MISRPKATCLRNSVNLFLNGTVIFENVKFATICAAHVMMVMHKHITQLDFGVAAYLRSGDNSQFFKQINISVYRNAIVFWYLGNKFDSGEGRVVLQYSKQPHSWLGNEVTTGL